jgi:N-ethylmaleimide reductase
MTNAVHEKGAQVFVQIMNAGRIAHPLNRQVPDVPVAPSAVKAAGSMWTDAGGMQELPQPRELATSEIPDVIAEYATATSLATTQAGFDGVELHSASGYLPNQFLSSNANLRGDKYGGSVINRCRFVLECLDAMIKAAGSSTKVGIKISPMMGFNDVVENDPEELYTTLLRELNPLKLAYVHVLRSKAMDVVPLVRKVYVGTVIAGGGYTAVTGADELEAKQADLIAYGVSFLANPDLPERFKRGAALNSADPETFYSPGPKGYVDYPTLQ